MNDRYYSFLTAHHQIMETIARVGHDRLSTIFTIDAADRVPFAMVGYNSDRWLKYVDAYLYGGKPFNEFLTQRIPRNSSSTFVFGGKRAHHRGPCILTMTVSHELVHLNARTLHWANAAILDLSLIWLIIKRLRRPVWLTCPRVTVLDWQLAAYRRLDDMDAKLSVVRSAKRIRKDPTIMTWDRHQKKARTVGRVGSLDEEEIVTTFPRVTPEDIARCVGIKGTYIRNYLRAKYGYAIKGEEKRSHSWASYSDPRFIEMCKALKINRGKLPSIETLVSRRLQA